MLLVMAKHSRLFTWSKRVLLPQEEIRQRKLAEGKLLEAEAQLEESQGMAEVRVKEDWSRHPSQCTPNEGITVTELTPSMSFRCAQQ